MVKWRGERRSKIAKNRSQLQAYFTAPSLLSVCSQHIHNYFVVTVPVPTKWQRKSLLGITIPMRHQLLLSTDQNWRSYWKLTWPKSQCSWPNYTYVVILAKLEIFKTAYIFFRPSKSFLDEIFTSKKFSSVPIRIKRSGHPGPSRFWENRLLKFQMPIFPYRSDFLCFVLGV